MINHPLRACALIKEFVKTLPHKPGVYRMYDCHNQVLYIGKAKDLKKRVSAYTKLEPHPARIKNAILATSSMEFIVTNSEVEALLLEATLIKQLQPRHNVLLRDDKSLPYIVISDHYRAGGIFKHRGPRHTKGEYFGPFATPKAVNETLAALQKLFGLRSCTDHMLDNRSRPCLLYQMKRCCGPCTEEINEKEYQEKLKQAKAFLKGRNKEIIDSLSQKMQQASQNMHYEEAARYRDHLRALEQIRAQNAISLQNLPQADVFAIAREGELICIQVFFYRYGQNWGNRSYFPKADSHLSLGEILQSFITQFYDDKEIAKLILISHSLKEEGLVEKALSLKKQAKITLRLPQRGERKRVLEHALLNAKEALARKKASSARQSYLLERFAHSFNLPHIPKRIEVYDNSHLAGQQAIGAMIVVGREGFLKKEYRKFNIKSLDLVAGDDYAMLKEVLTRRLRTLTSSEHNKHNNREQWPDILLIDGGKGHLSASREILKQYNLNSEITAIAIAKGRNRNAGCERFFIKEGEEIFLPPQDETRFFLQRIRDEAHRFAINIHRQKRQKTITNNPLNNISNIGPGRKKALLQHFGSAKAVAQADIGELSKVKGISKKLAEKIYFELKQ